MIASTAGALVAVSTARPANATPTPSPIALGVSVSDPGKPADLNAYISAAGRNPAIVMWFQSFDEPLYYSNQLPTVDSLGATPMITWVPVHAGVGIRLRDIATGAEDTYLKQQAASAGAWGKPMFIRFAHEMNLTSSPWGPGVDGNTSADYIAAWRHVVTIFRDAGATNVSWVWSPNVDCGGRCPFDSFYPGDSWVDWVALDGYNYGPVADEPWMSLAQIFGSSYDELTALTTKPLMIAETASTETGGDKAAWITNSFLTDIPDRAPHVRAVIWFQRTGETDWRINSSPTAQAAFRAVASSPEFSADAASLAPISGASPVSAVESQPPTAPSVHTVSTPSGAGAGQSPAVTSPNAAPGDGNAAPGAFSQPANTATPDTQSSPGASPAFANAASAKPLPPSGPTGGNPKARATHPGSRQPSGPARSRKAQLRAAHQWPARLPHWFWRWAAWRRQGTRNGARPGQAPTRIPRWAWRRLNAY